MHGPGENGQVKPLCIERATKARRKPRTPRLLECTSCLLILPCFCQYRKSPERARHELYAPFPALPPREILVLESSPHVYRNRQMKIWPSTPRPLSGRRGMALSGLNIIAEHCLRGWVGGAAVSRSGSTSPTRG